MHSGSVRLFGPGVGGPFGEAPASEASRRHFPQSGGNASGTDTAQTEGKVVGVDLYGPDPADLAGRKDLDVFFLALPHGTAAEYAVPLVKAGRRVIDLSLIHI